MSRFDQDIAREFDECQRTGNPEWLAGWLEAGMDLVYSNVSTMKDMAAGGKPVERGILAEALARDVLDLLNNWRKHVGCCGLMRGMMAGAQDYDPDHPVATEVVHVQDDTPCSRIHCDREHRERPKVVMRD